MYNIVLFVYRSQLVDIRVENLTAEETVFERFDVKKENI